MAAPSLNQWNIENTNTQPDQSNSLPVSLPSKTPSFKEWSGTALPYLGEDGPGVGKQIGQGLLYGLKSGGALIAKGVLEYDKWFYNTFNKGKDIFNEDYQPYYERDTGTIKKYEENIHKKLVDRLGEEGANSFITQASAGVAQGAGQIAAFALHPVVGFTTLAAQTVGAGKQAYDEAFEATGDPKIAKINGLVTGSVNALEAVPVFRALKGFSSILEKPIEVGLSSTLKQLTKTALLESGTEGAQQFAQDFTAQQTYDKNRTPLKNAIMASLLSLPTGILFGSVEKIGSYSKTRELNRVKNEIVSYAHEAGLPKPAAKQMAETIVNNYAVLGDENIFEDPEIHGRPIEIPQSMGFDQSQLQLPTNQELSNIAQYTKSMKVGITSARPETGPNVTSETLPKLHEYFNEVGIKPERAETDTYGLYFGEPEPSYWLEIPKNQESQSLSALAKFAKENSQDSFIVSKDVPIGEGTPSVYFQFDKNLSPEQIKLIQKAFNDSGVGLTINAKTGEAYAHNINEFDGMTPDQFLDSIEKAIDASPNLRDFSIDASKVDVYTKDNYDKLIEQPKLGTKGGKSEGAPDFKGSKTQLKSEAEGGNGVVRAEETKQESLKPVGEGETLKSQLGVGVEAKAIEKKLTEGFEDLPEYQRVNMKDQAEKAAELIAKDYDQALRIALGEEAPPKGLIPEAVFIGIENKALAEGNVELLRQLATSELVGEATAMGQRIRTLAERDPGSPIKAMQEVVNARKKAFEDKSGTKASKAKREEVKKLKAELEKTKPKFKDWDSFIKSIEC